ncbi:C-type lectin domain family 4 member K [Cricetulus griseus]|uniref:C-type lectin domain family 4 member K n=1 Tax=Cricetulus griseus TaxID=10029 RepID=A0A9J7JYC8_CRIGR|nr:C-type lectin domain family 4 member K [Cricetulus griseus]XP_027284333.1 C-type lectin domain family 4 member K [Cricetulus griseus]
MPEVKMKESEAPDAHFTVDKQNISLWPREPPPKPDLSPVLRKPLSLRVAFICLSLVLVASIVLQAVFYPRLVDKILDVKSDAQMLRDRADNISSLGSVLEKDRGRVEEAEVQIQILNTSLTRARSQILSLRIIMEQASAQISVLTRNWEEVDSLSSKIPELQRDLDKSSALNAKVRGLQNSLENVNKLLQRQSDILEMVSRGWKYFGGNLYYFSYTPKTWYSAEQSCISRDAHLTSVTSESEQEFLYKSADRLPCWIGLTKAGTEGHWYWVDGTLFNKEQSKRFWIPGEPNNTGNNEHCGNIRVSSLQAWNDASCDSKFPFICKRPFIQAIP